MKPKLATILSMLFIGLASSTVFANTVLDKRTIPLPVGVSTEFSSLVEQRGKQPPIDAVVPTTNEEWIKFQTMFDQAGIQLSQQALERSGATFETKQIAGVDTFLVTPKEIAPKYKDKWLVHIHGGAFVFGGGESAMREAIWVASGLGAQVISIDYRQPPLHAFPAAIDDVVAVWKALIETQDPEATAMFGTSAGGNLTLASTLKLQELGLPTPGALFAGTPAVDLKETSDTWHTLKGLDPLGQREGVIQGAFDLYANGEFLDNPLLSPINAKIESFPPTILLSGTRDLLLSDTVRMHRLLRSAGIESDLHVYDGQAHADYMSGLIVDIPESDDALKELGLFFDKHIN